MDFLRINENRYRLVYGARFNFVIIYLFEVVACPIRHCICFFDFAVECVADSFYTTIKSLFVPKINIDTIDSIHNDKLPVLTVSACLSLSSTIFSAALEPALNASLAAPFGIIERKTKTHNIEMEIFSN